MSRLAAAGHRGVLAIPGTAIDFTDHEMSVAHPIADDAVEAIFEHKAEYLRQYQADWMPWLTEMHRSWSPPSTDLLATLKEWWEPLLAMAPALRSGIGDRCLLHAGDLAVIIDFPNGDVREFADEEYGFRFDIQRELVETVVAQRSIDWSNALFLSCRFRAWRAGAFNEYLYNFFKSLSIERMPRRGRSEAAIRPASRFSRRRGPDRRLHHGTAVSPPSGRISASSAIDDGRTGLHAARMALRPRDRALPRLQPIAVFESAGPIKQRSTRFREQH